MVRLLLAAALLAAAARPTAADGFYFLEGFGGTKLGDELGERLDDGAHIRGALGHRSGNLAVEVWMRIELTPDYAGAAGRTALDDPGTYGVDLKLIQPISRRWSVYARGGAGRSRRRMRPSSGSRASPVGTVDERGGVTATRAWWRSVSRPTLGALPKG